MDNHFDDRDEVCVFTSFFCLSRGQSICDPDVSGFWAFGGEVLSSVVDPFHFVSGSASDGKPICPADFSHFLLPGAFELC